MSQQLRCPECKTPLVRGEGACDCGDFYFYGRVRGPTRGGQLRVGGRNYSSENGGRWNPMDWETKDRRGEHPQTPTNGRVSCSCCDQSHRSADFRSLPGSWTYGR